MKDDTVYLQHILECINRIEHHVGVTVQTAPGSVGVTYAKMQHECKKA